MRRVVAFAHYDAHKAIKPFILHHLAELKGICDEIHFASTAELAADELAKLNGLVTTQRLCENTGYDFGMWARMIADLHLDAWDELVLTNSSVYGPVTPLAQLFSRMNGEACDFWGLTDSLEIEYHIQSFFLVFRKSILDSGHIQKFFASVLPYRHKWQVIRSYEVGLTHYFLDQGFIPSVVASVIGSDLRLGVCNPCMCVPVRLIDLGVPYVKVELLRDNPLQLRLGPVRARMAALGYSLELVDPEENPRQSFLSDFRNRLNLQLQRWGTRGKSTIPLRADVSTKLRLRPRDRAPAKSPSDGKI